MSWIDELSEAWQREHPDYDTATLPPMVRLARLALLIDGFQHDVLAPYRLSAGDYGVLAALRRAGAPYQLRPSMLYSRLQRSSGGMTKTLGRLEERGLVARTPDPLDRRGSLVSLTRKGQTLQEEVFRAYLEATEDLLEPFSETQLKDTDRVLEALLALFEGRAAS